MNQIDSWWRGRGAGWLKKATNKKDRRIIRRDIWKFLCLDEEIPRYRRQYKGYVI